MSYCPYCGESIKDNAKFCGKCGKGLPEKPVIPVLETGNERMPKGGRLEPDNDKKPERKDKKALIAVIVAAAALTVIVCALTAMLLKGGTGGTETKKPKTTERTTVQAEDTTKKAPAKTTKANTTSKPSTTKPVTTEKIIKIPPATAQMTFYDFYRSYLTALNSSDASMMGYCSDQVANQMEERFDINKKSYFEFQKIGYDMNSVKYSQSGSIAKVSFYAKCITSKFDRADGSYTEDNSAIWYVTISMGKDKYCYVSALKRNDKYKMSKNITWETGSADIDY